MGVVPAGEVEVYLGLGANLGDRAAMIRRAIAALPGQGVSVQRGSRIIETEPVGGPPQGRFLNAVVHGRTRLAPAELLRRLQDLERALGRVPTVRYGPRAIDIDILLYGRWRLVTPELVIPHPRMWERDFVMTPLRELAGDLRPEMFPGAGADLATIPRITPPEESS